MKCKHVLDYDTGEQCHICLKCHDRFYIEDLLKQINKMKNCYNCRHLHNMTCDSPEKCMRSFRLDASLKDLWEMEND